MPTRRLLPLRALPLTLTLALALACAPRVDSLRAPPGPEFDPEFDPNSVSVSAGEQIYTGEVFLPGEPTDASPTYRYERWVEDDPAGARAIHLTLDREGRALVRQVGTHDGDYRLSSYEEHHAQLGWTRRAEAHADGSWTLHLRPGQSRALPGEDRGASAAELVVGPTLFGFALRHFDALLAGEVVPLRFLSLEAGKAYAFSLRRESSADGRTVLLMSADRPMVRAFVPDMRLTFTSADRAIERYEGRVPQKRRQGGRWRAIDARVEYAFTSPRYR